MTTKFQQTCKEWVLLFEQDFSLSLQEELLQQRPPITITDFHYGYPFHSNDKQINFRVIADDENPTNKLHLTWCGRLENMEEHKKIIPKLKHVSLEDIQAKVYPKARMCVACLRLLYGKNLKISYEEYVKQQLLYFDTKESRDQIKDTIFHSNDTYKDRDVIQPTEIVCARCEKKFPRTPENFEVFFEDGNPYNTHRFNTRCYCQNCYKEFGTEQKEPLDTSV